MITVLVQYKEWRQAAHAMLDGGYIPRSKVVEVNKLTDLNDMFSRITKVDILLKVDEYTEALRQLPVSVSLPKSCYRQCPECNKWRMIGTMCKDPKTNQCDKDERYFYREKDC